MRQLRSISEAAELMEQFGSKKTLSNNYMLQDEIAAHINKGYLFFLQQAQNSAFLLKKRGFYRLYYYLNMLSESFEIAVNEPVVQEILYRGEKHFPEKELTFWKENGFQEHLGRDCYFAKPREVTAFAEKTFLEKGISIEVLQQAIHLEEARQMIEEYLDHYTGDILSLAEIQHFAQRNELFGVFENGQLAGILQAEFKQKTYWLGHMVVKSAFRGRKFSTLLLKHYFHQGLRMNCRQFQLWVIINNKPALSLYKKYGFQYMNKSTISLLRTHG